MGGQGSGGASNLLGGSIEGRGNERKDEGEGRTDLGCNQFIGGGEGGGTIRMSVDPDSRTGGTRSRLHLHTGQYPGVPGQTQARQGRCYGTGTGIVLLLVT